jgi:hypothetical protein
MLYSGYALGQVNSIASGNWNANSTWSCNCIPVSGAVVIHGNHTVTIPSGYVAAAASLTVQNLGVLQQQHNLAPTIPTVTFESGSQYNHSVNGGVIPTSTWQSGSTCRITGTTTLLPTGITQAFHHFTYDCVGQTAAAPFLQGNLNNIGGNLTINNTGNNRQLNLGSNSGAFNGTINIGGSLIVNNLARIQLGTSGTTTVNVGNDVHIAASSLIPASPPNPAVTINNLIMTTNGPVTLNISDDLIIDGGGKLNMLGATASSVSVNVIGDFNFTSGIFTRESSSASTVNFTFNGSIPQVYTGGGTFEGQPINYRISSTADVALQTFALGQPNSTFTNDGIVRLASLDPTSAIAGNIRPNTRTFSSGSTIIYNGAAEQFMGTTHPSGTNVTTTISNSSNVTLTADATIGGPLNLLSGDINISNRRLTLLGTLNAGANHLNITSSSSLEIGGSGPFGLAPFDGGTDINSLTIARTSGAILIEQDLTIQGALTQTAGDIHLDGVDLILNGAFARTSGSIISNDPASTFVVQGSGAVPTTAEFSGTFARFELNRDAVTLGTTSVFTVQNLVLRSGTLNNTSDLIVPSGGTIQRFVGSLSGPVDGTGSLFVTYSNQEDVSSGAELTPVTPNRLEDITINGSANVLLSNNITVNGDLNIESGGFLAQNRTVTLENNLIVDGTADFGQSIIIFDGNTTVSGSSLPLFGTLTVTSGNTLTLPSNADMGIAGNVDFPATATVNATNISMTLNGADLQTISTNGRVLNNLTLNKIDESDVVVASSLPVTGQVLILSLNTDLNSSGFLTLVSTSDAGEVGDAWIGTLDGSTISGSVHVQRFMSDEGNLYRYISSPITGMSVDDLNNYIYITGAFTGSSTCVSCGTLPSMFSYNNATLAYAPFPTASVDEEMEVGVGYSTFIFQNAMSPPGPVTLDFFGPINQGALPLTVGFNNPTPGQSWNLVGNPYPATIDWDDAGGWIKGSSVLPGIAVRENPTGVHRYWDGETGDLVDGLIAKGQAFWVQTQDDTDLTLEINELAKASPVPAPFLRGAGAEMDGLILTLTNSNGLTDKTYLKERLNSSLSLDRLDIPKLNNQYFDIATYTFEGARTSLAINAIEHMECIEKVDVVTKDMTAGNYVLSVKLSGKFSSRNWKLYDKFTSTTQSFNEGTYSFTVTGNTASAAIDRFEMILDIERPNPALDVVAVTPNVCGDAAVIMIPNAQSSFNYELLVNGVATDEEYPGTSDLAIKVGNNLLKPGANKIEVSVLGGCPQHLIKTVSVTKHEAITATVASRTECLSGSYKIDASGSDSFNWYASADDGAALAQGKSFTTPSINTSTTYYVSAVNANGCEGSRVPATISITMPTEVAISIIPDNGVIAQLVSNYVEGNQWSYNGSIIDGATGQTLKADKTGQYSVAVTYNGCTATGAVDYSITGLEADSGTAVAWPNPVQTKLTIDIPSELKVKALWMQTSSGGLMERRNNPSGSITIDMQQYTPGLYLLVMDTDLGRKVQKIIRN